MVGYKDLSSPFKKVKMVNFMLCIFCYTKNVFYVNCNTGHLIQNFLSKCLGHLTIENPLQN
jgi:hypothetical protein